jgi:LysM repeat protein
VARIHRDHVGEDNAFLVVNETVSLRGLWGDLSHSVHFPGRYYRKENAMAVPLRTEKRPVMPVLDHVAPPGRPYRVNDGDDWSSVARAAGVKVWELIEFNFHTSNPDEVNW